MGKIDPAELLGLIDSTKGEIICKDCLSEEQLLHFPDEEAITATTLEAGGTYVCSRCHQEIQA